MKMLMNVRILTQTFNDAIKDVSAEANAPFSRRARLAESGVEEADQKPFREGR